MRLSSMSIKLERMFMNKLMFLIMMIGFTAQLHALDSRVQTILNDYYKENSNLERRFNTRVWKEQDPKKAEESAYKILQEEYALEDELYADPLSEDELRAIWKELKQENYFEQLHQIQKNPKQMDLHKKKKRSSLLRDTLEAEHEKFMRRKSY